MPRAEQSVTISGDPDHIFAVSNDIARWPDLFVQNEYPRLLTSQRCGQFARLEYELRHGQGQTWRSWRILDYEKRLAIAQRETPMFPYRYMHITWCYEPAEGGVRMTWLHDFEMDPNAPIINEQALAETLEHMTINQMHFKQVLEKER